MSAPTPSPEAIVKDDPSHERLFVKKMAANDIEDAIVKAKKVIKDAFEDAIEKVKKAGCVKKSANDNEETVIAGSAEEAARQHKADALLNFTSAEHGERAAAQAEANRDKIVDLLSHLEKSNKLISDVATELNGFKTAANIYSISSTSKFGGRIGLMNEKQLSKRILKEIKSIKVGEITKTIDVPSGFLILKLEDKIVESFEKDLKKELENLVRFETDRQLNQFSIVYYNKLKLNSKIIYE